MNVLIGWDNAAEAETIALCLNIGETTALVANSVDEFREALASTAWDAVVLALSFPDEDRAYDLFLKAHELHPNAPVIGACHQGQIIQLSRFLNRGLHSHITRDDNGEFIFLLPTVISVAHEAAQAARNRELNLRLQEEIESVRKLQEAVIPQDISVPDAYTVAARYEPSQIRVVGGQPVVLAGGDYYDVVSLADNEQVIIVGDASGHGMKACMSIMTMHTLIQMIREERFNNTADYVVQVNERLCANELIVEEGGFITLLYCLLDTATHTLEWTSAGHPMPLLHDLGTGEVRPLADDDDAGPPLGITDALPYEKCSATIPPNCRVLLYTDGLAEAMADEEGEAEEFGIAGIAACLQATQEQGVEETLEHLFYESNAHTRGAGRHDDTSVVLLQRNH
ncbi:MAG: PP2C family protein-serine/threonine phosphatase [Planctomycetota bacterium]|nr:PP2C family protein-serine/threonine phosphatase [Planctomycetota bacterium]